MQFHIQKRNLVMTSKTTVPVDRLKRLFPTPFLYRQRPAGKLGGYCVQEDREVRFYRTTVSIDTLRSLHKRPIPNVRISKTFLESHDFYADEEHAGDGAPSTDVLYPVGLTGYSLPPSTRASVVVLVDRTFVTLDTTLCLQGFLAVLKRQIIIDFSAAFQQRILMRSEGDNQDVGEGCARSKDRLQYHSTVHMNTGPPLVATATDTNWESKRLLVVKVGTSTMMETKNLNFCLSNLGKFVDAVCRMKADGYQVVLVSSGAVGAGCIHLKLKERPATLEGKQAASARLYEDLFAIREQKVAQLIMTRPDLMDRTRFINFKNTLKELLRLNVLPIINENDSIAAANLQFGDNDTLAAYVAVSLKAQWLFLLTDVDCLYTKNPRIHSDAQPIPFVGHLDDVYALLDESENSGTSWGTGGMRTKIIAAKIATATGIHTALCHGEHPERVLDVIKFAETHAQTAPMWRRFLQSLVNDNKIEYTNAEAGDNNSEGDACLPPNFPRPPSSTDVSGLSHHHHTTTTTTTTTQSLRQKGARRTPSLHTRDLFDESSCHFVDDDNVWGIVTASSLSKMPYLATIFGAQECTQNIRDQRRWILSLPVRGRVYVDAGAARAVVEGKKSLFAAGITAVEGTFYEGEAVIICRDDSSRRRLCGDAAAVRPPMRASASPPVQWSPGATKSHTHGSVKNNVTTKDRMFSPKDTLPLESSASILSDEIELARCLVNFSSVELDKIKGLKSEMFKNVLGYECDAEVAHRDNIIFINPCAVYGCHQCGEIHQDQASMPNRENMCRTSTAAT